VIRSAIVRTGALPSSRAARASSSRPHAACASHDTAYPAATAFRDGAASKHCRASRAEASASSGGAPSSRSTRAWSDGASARTIGEKLSSTAVRHAARADGARFSTRISAICKYAFIR